VADTAAIKLIAAANRMLHLVFVIRVTAKSVTIPNIIKAKRVIPVNSDAESRVILIKNWEMTSSKSAVIIITVLIVFIFNP
jgi:hypothetical protein